MVNERNLTLALNIGIKALFIVAVFSSIALTYQRIIITGDYAIATIPDGPDKSEFTKP